MAHILQNQLISVHVDSPEDHYQSSRFDWTGKIIRITYKGRDMTTTEFPDKGPFNQGMGLYNEFGIDQPIGFDEVKEGDWFHKIGVGLLQKAGSVYDFQIPYNIRPAQFDTSVNEDQISVICKSKYGGYSYVLEKEICLEESGFRINYCLTNSGQKVIQTNEYVHNFMSIHAKPIGSPYLLSLPFKTEPSLFIETVNPENLVDISGNQVSFSGQPSTPFFFSNISGLQPVEAKWTLYHKELKIGISETGNFKTNAVNLWGTGHVISPELFFQVDLNPGDTTRWSRAYCLFEQE